MVFHRRDHVDDVDDDRPIDTDTGESVATGTPPANPALDGDWNLLAKHSSQVPALPAAFN